MKEARLSSFEVEELMCYLTETNDCDEDYDTCEMEDKFYDMYDVDVDQFSTILRILVPLIDVGESPIDGTVFKGFACEKSNGDKKWKEWLLNEKISG